MAGITDINTTVRTLIEGMCGIDSVKSLYDSSVEIAENYLRLPKNSEEYRQVVVLSVLGYLEGQSDEPIFEKRLGKTGLPDAYRFHTNAKVGGRLKGGTVVVLEKGTEKGDFIPASDIYKWLSGRE